MTGQMIRIKAIKFEEDVGVIRKEGRQVSESQFVIIQGWFPELIRCVSLRNVTVR